ncbi:ATP-binding cassette domain-containing protein [Candidatus Nitronereus thalassa]|uniref:ATP-binding cassette domain-containing protein n=1 Tax=Candidatus Nitronereus thalassa TaxID=3020898 RepID=A0ABU3K973_9BACT|nr:ATP-binding cassette domain-containing protein [Candidatus Nitronereus thalassa]MDT7042946.1 ATP-binding cassette domain-containing protein [Candidatus Nitronereus thalassa]
MGSIVEIQQLRKTFGSIVAVDQVTFTVGQGEVLGFLGPNGAGKSTTMKMITGFLTPTSGTVKVNGFDIQAQPLDAKKSLGYLPEGAPAYSDMTPWTFLLFIGEMRGFKGEDLKRRVSDTIKKVNLEGVIGQPIETLSKGFKRRVGLAQAILHDPSVLILDEPTDGLDPNQKHEVRELIKEMAREKAIILSTHILEEVHAVCTRAIIIAKGKVITDGTPADLEARSRYHNAVILRFQGALPDGAVDVLRGVSGVKGVEELKEGEVAQGFCVLPEGGQPILNAISECAKNHHWSVAEVSVDRGQLDDVFRSLTMPAQALT